MATADRQNKRGDEVAILVRDVINFDVVNPTPTSNLKGTVNNYDTNHDRDTTHLNIVLSQR